MPEPESEPPSITPVGAPKGLPTTYRVALPHAGIVPTAPGHFEATEYAEDRRGLRGALLDIKDVVVGPAIATGRLAEQRISKKLGLAVFSSDALSSTAYATQEIILILVLAGTTALDLSLPIALAITGLLAIVVVSYRQIIRAYPGGGGAYIVGHENLGVFAGLTAGSALLIDYVLTVAVSIAACVEAIVSAVPEVHSYAVLVAVGLVILIAMGNLRGVRESGTVFAIPTYGFVAILGATIAIGIVQTMTSADRNLFATGAPTREVEGTEALTLFLVLRAFAAGCTALTGVEAIANGVPAFREPQARNAATTLTAMALILGALFLGTTLLARHFGIVYQDGDTETVMSQIGEHVFGRNALYYALQVFTAGILFLAANTSYNGFPLLGAILARDGYLPRLFHQRGNRLVFSYGIAALTLCTVFLLIVFGADTTRLIPLYALGVFLSFTIAQAGMVRRWSRGRGAGWQRAAAINGLGAATTAAVFIVILTTKFLDGAWMVVLALPVIGVLLYRIGGYYRKLRRVMNVPPEAVFDMVPRGTSRVPVLVPIEEVNLPTVIALGAACERSSRVQAVHVEYDPEHAPGLVERWERQFPGIPLVVIDSPYRTVAEPLAWYVLDRVREWPNEVTVVVPVVIPRRAWHRPLVNQSTKRLRALVRGRRVNVVDQAFPV
jgi:amino acid transporter